MIEGMGHDLPEKLWPEFVEEIGGNAARGRTGACTPRPAEMRLKGVEPSRAFAHTDLNRARLPVPPQPRGAGNVPGAASLESPTHAAIV